MAKLLEAERLPRRGCLQREGGETWFYPDRKKFSFCGDGCNIIEVKTKAIRKALRDIDKELRKEKRK